MTPESILLALASLVGSTLVSTIISTIIKKAVEKRMDSNFATQEELHTLRAEKERQERRSDVVNTIREELQPLNNKVDQLAIAVNNNIEGIVTQLRESMKQTRDQFKLQGYVSASDWASWHELYNTYKKLGGNHFKEYVDAWKTDVESLPRREEE